MSSIKEKRIHILSPYEISELYERPHFNTTERIEAFSLDNEILSLTQRKQKIETKAYIILMLGYFRFKPVISHFRFDEVFEDLNYVCSEYFPSGKIPQKDLSKRSKSNVAETVLELVNFSQYNKKKHYQQLLARLKDVATICIDPRYIFDECLAFFGQERIALPGYTSIQDIVSKALTSERQRVADVLAIHLSDKAKKHFKEALFTKATIDPLIAIKTPARDFSKTELANEIQTHQVIRKIYPELKRVIKSLQLSQGNLEYYAAQVKNKPASRLRNYKEPHALLYLSCFLYFRYMETNDNLVAAFRYLTRKQKEAAQLIAKQEVADKLAVIQEKLQVAGNLLYLFIDESVSDTTEFGAIRKQAFELISEEEIQTISQHLHKNDFNKTEYEWKAIEKQSRKIAGTLRKLFLVIDIECESDDILIKQIQDAKNELDKHGKILSADQRVILKSDKKYLVEDDLVNHSRFEFYLYKRVCQKFDRGDFFVPESEQNKRLEDDLIPEDVWCRNKFNLIENTGLERLNTPIDLIITELSNKLSNKITKACQRINGQDNDFVTYLPKEAKLKWSIANRKWQEPVTNPIYGQIDHLNIIEILDFVQNKTDFLRAFEHISKQRRNYSANPDDLLACIFGQGANYGIYKMSNISDRNIGTLRLVNDNYLRIETLHKANDIISNATAELLIFKHYTIHEPAPFASIDGQKFKCRINTFKARYSSKYFKKGKGVSAITLVSNHVPVNTDIISPNQYEGHFAFDLLYNNTTDLNPKTLSTDGHGVNRVNHAILDIFGYSFAPRYPKFKDIFSDLFDVMFDDELKIQLKTPINKNLLKSEWDSIQHIICSLSRKTTKQSIVIQKLSNSKRNNKTLMALREYDRLIKALYVIEYLDNKTLRHFVQQALNRGESFHQLRRAIASISGNQFRGGTDYQIEISNDCARLICNAIIFYNSALLSELLNIVEQKKDTKSVEVIANLSPVAWQHISLTGFYHFGQEKVDIDLQGMLDAIDPLL